MFVADKINSTVKGISKNLVGQPLFKQIINLLPRNKFDALVLVKGSGNYYNTFTHWNQLITLLFGSNPTTKYIFSNQFFVPHFAIKRNASDQ
jgi:hypothetical protein